MLIIKRTPKRLCYESITCYYYAPGICTFWDKAEEVLRIRHEKYHKGLNSVINIADTFELPCKILDEEGRQRGIGNIFTDPSTMH